MWVLWFSSFWAKDNELKNIHAEQQTKKSSKIDLNREV